MANFDFDDEPTTQDRANALIQSLRARQAMAPQVSPSDIDTREKFGNLETLIGGGLAPLGHSDLQAVQQARSVTANPWRNAMAEAALERAGNTSRIIGDKENPTGAYAKGLVSYGHNGLGQVIAQDTTKPGAQVVDDAVKPSAPLRRLGRGRGGGASPGGPAVPNDKELAALMKDIDPSLGRSGLFGKDQGIRTAASKVMALVKNPDTGAENYNLTVKQMPEFVQSVAGMLSSGSVPAQAQLEHLMPHTAGLSLAEKLEYLTGHPEEANQPEFVRQYAETAKREDSLAAKRIQQVQLQRLAAHQGAYAHNPAAAKALARQYLTGLSDTDLDAAFQGTYKPGTGGASAPVAESPVSARIKQIIASGVTDKAAIKAQLVKEGLAK